MGFKIGPIPKIKVKVKTPKVTGKVTGKGPVKSGKEYGKHLKNVKAKKDAAAAEKKKARRKKTGEMLSALGGAIGGGQTSEGDTYNPNAERGQEKVELNPFDEQNTNDAAGR